MVTTSIRTCIGCRARKPDQDLVRVVVVDGDLVIDKRGQGRGAWLCRNESCVAAAAQSKAFSRAFRTKLADGFCADTLLGWLGKPTH
jgi:predicted RNA-binding protein YlxR (DUF448 family)